MFHWDYNEDITMKTNLDTNLNVLRRIMHEIKTVKCGKCHESTKEKQVETLLEKAYELNLAPDDPHGQHFGRTCWWLLASLCA